MQSKRYIAIKINLKVNNDFKSENWYLKIAVIKMVCVDNMHVKNFLLETKLFQNVFVMKDFKVQDQLFLTIIAVVSIKNFKYKTGCLCFRYAKL